MLLVALGAAIGGPARFLVSGWVGRTIGETFPWGTLAVNVAGCFLIGAFAAGAPAHGPWLFFGTGFLGSFTTVSSFSLQTLALTREGDARRAALNVVLSLSLGLLAAGAGFAMGSR
jgi:CrcB protein